MRKLLTFIIFFSLALGGVASAYQIQKGDTLTSIAKRFDTSVDELVALNDIQDENVIYSGDFIETEGLLFGATPTPTSSAARIYVEAPDWQLFNGAAAGDTTLTLDDLEDIYGNEVTMSSSSKMYGRINPDGVTESISFTGITTNSDGTKTLTGVKSVLGQYPYTETSGLVRSHSIGALFRLTNTAGFYNDFANKENEEIISKTWRYDSYPTVLSSLGMATTTYQLVTKQYADSIANQGAATSTESVAGIAELSTQAEMAASTDYGVLRPLVLQAKYATSTRNSTGNYVVITAGSGYVSSTFGGVAFSMATLNSSALVVENPASASITASTSSIPITSSVTSTLDRSWIPFKFGGDGSDGVLNLTSGTTTIDLGGVAVVTKNYTSINISAGAALVFTNPSSTGSVVILKSQATTTIAGNISVTSTGGAGGAARSGSTGAGTAGTSQSIYQNLFGSGAGAAASDAGAGGGVTVSTTLAFGKSSVFRRYHDIVIGAGGGSGNLENNANGNDFSGYGGRGAGALIIESNGALNFTGNIFAYGQNGGNGFTDASPGGAGGGGGGGGGYVRILYQLLVANTGTINVSGGTGGNGSVPNPGTLAGGGGGGSATPGNAGVADSGDGAQSGGNGGTGVSIVEKNEFYY